MRNRKQFRQHLFNRNRRIHGLTLLLSAGIPTEVLCVDSTSTEKRLLRAHLRKEREIHFTPESWLHILQSREIQSAEVVASYISYGYEPQTIDINSALLRARKTLLLPRLLADKDIEWVIWDGSQSSLRQNGKILEPMGESYLDLGSIDVAIVPALHVDRAGNRMGQGGGSYDRALARISGWKLALVGAKELSEVEIPVEGHDQKVDAAATPGLILRFSRDSPGHL